MLLGERHFGADRGAAHVLSVQGLCGAAHPGDQMAPHAVYGTRAAKQRSLLAEAQERVYTGGEFT